jgi:hypothetical protein
VAFRTLGRHPIGFRAVAGFDAVGSATVRDRVILPRNLGDLGEDFLQVWCSQVGIVPNRVERDRTGWDFLIEFPAPEVLDERARGALDRQRPVLRAFLQVKATDKAERNITVKLDNLVRLMQTSDPAFFLVVDFGGREEPRSARLIEVGEAFIRRVLRRLRKLSANGRLGDLKRRSMSFSISDGRAMPTNGEGLRSTIADVVGDLDAYRARKERWRAEV